MFGAMFDTTQIRFYDAKIIPMLNNTAQAAMEENGCMADLVTDDVEADFRLIWFLF